jgi:hypothetical protein
MELYNKRQHSAPAALVSQQVARLGGGSYVYQKCTSL